MKEMLKRDTFSHENGLQGTVWGESAEGFLFLIYTQ